MDDTKKIQEEANLGLDLCEKGNLEEGIKHLRYAANHNHKNAITNLGHALKLLGNYEEAFDWTLKGASLGIVTAMSNLAIMYRRAQGTPCNVEEGVKWGKKIIESGDIDGGYEEIVCSYIYAEDESQRNYEKALEYAIEGSEEIIKKNPNPKKGDKCETVIQLALAYDFGKGTEVDKKKAIKYYSYCCMCGLGIAYYNLGCIYCFSEDESIKDIDKGLDLFEGAAKVGYGDGYFELGYLKHVGEIVEEDLNAATYYYSKAIRMGNGECHYDDAINNLSEISPKLSDLALSGKYNPIID